MNKLILSLLFIMYVILNFVILQDLDPQSLKIKIAEKVFFSVTIAGLLSYSYAAYKKFSFRKFLLILFFTHSLSLVFFSYKFDYTIKENLHRASLIEEIFYCKDEKKPTDQANYFLSQMTKAGFKTKSSISKSQTKDEETGDCILRKKEEPLGHYWYRSSLYHYENFQEKMKRFSTLNFYEYLLQQVDTFASYMYLISDFTNNKRQYRNLWVEEDSYLYIKSLIEQDLNINSLNIKPISSDCEGAKKKINDLKIKRTERADNFCSEFFSIQEHQSKLKELYTEYGFQPMELKSSICEEHKRGSLVLDYCIDDLGKAENMLTKLQKVEAVLSAKPSNSLSVGIRGLKKKKIDQVLSDTNSFLAFELLTEIDARDREPNYPVPNAIYAEKLKEGIHHAISIY